jgi:hypothetical protein
VDEFSRPEAARLGPSGGFGEFESGERFGRVREVLKGAREAGVKVRPEDVNANIVDGMLDVRSAGCADGRVPGTRRISRSR